MFYPADELYIVCAAGSLSTRSSLHQTTRPENYSNDTKALRPLSQFTMHTASTDAKSPDFDSRHFRDALSQFATGVTVITTQLGNGGFFGLTASSFNSVSLDPPLVLWSLSNQATSLPLFTGNSHYVINVLSANQTHLADRFSRRIGNRFEGVEFELSHTGLPIIKAVAAWFECHNRSRYPEGDHVIFVGEVERCDIAPQAPLVFHRRRFLSTQDI